MTTPPSEAHCSTTRLSDRAGRSAYWDSHSFKKKSKKNVLADTVQFQIQFPDWRGWGRVSGPCAAQRGRCPRLVRPTRRGSQLLREAAAIPLSAWTRSVLSCRLCFWRISFFRSWGFFLHLSRRTERHRVRCFVDLGTPFLLKCDLSHPIGIDSRSCVNPEEGRVMGASGSRPRDRRQRWGPPERHPGRDGAGRAGSGGRAPWAAGRVPGTWRVGRSPRGKPRPLVNCRSADAPRHSCPASVALAG